MFLDPTYLQENVQKGKINFYKLWSPKRFNVLYLKWDGCPAGEMKNFYVFMSTDNNLFNVIKFWKIISSRFVSF